MDPEMIDITLTGFVASDVEAVTEGAQEPAVTFRLGSSTPAFDRATGAPVDDSPQWFTVKLNGRLASNAAASLRSGDRIIVSGRFAQRQWETLGQIKSELTLEASALGHDLAWGTSSFTTN